MDWGVIIVPIITALIGAFATYLVQKNLQEKRDIERRLSEKRQETYMQLLDPYIKLFADIKGQGANQAIKDIVSYDYKKTAFELNLIGSDDVVLAYNELMQHTYKAEETGKKDSMEMIRLWGNLLLEIRKSLGNRKTKLNEKDMLSAMIKDIDKFIR